MFRFLVIIASVFAAAQAFGGGAPTSVCNDLTPKHPAEPQEVASPFTISISKSVIKPGDEVKVTLEGTNGNKFKGFIVQGRVGDSIVGSFEVNPNDEEVQFLNCPSGTNNAATHRNPKPKSKISVNWVAPKDLQDVVVFKATFVKEGDIFWVAQASSGLTVRH